MCVVVDPLNAGTSCLAVHPHWYGAGPTGLTGREKERGGAVQLFASACQSTIRAACRLPAERTLFLHYDEIAGDPVSALAKVLHHLGDGNRSEEHTSELQSLMRISYAVFCLKTKTNHA